tara:strand:- start:14 stop:520 length:507 start_codon:yes stop_codon:yes gene_type:complete
MTTPTIQSQKLVTEGTIQLLEFDFTSIGGTEHVYLSTEHNEISGSYVPVEETWIDGVSHTFDRIDFEVSGISCDLTGSVPEPTLKVAADSLWALSGWASATNGFGLMDFRGLRIRRQRFFYNISTLIVPQVFYVKSVDELNPSTISFTLTPSLGSERLDRPSARKLEI